MYIAVINRPNDTERLERFQKEMEGQGNPMYNVFPGIHDISSIKKGINLAHKSCIEYAKVADLPEICVMEDDVRGTNPNSWKFFLENKPKDFDIYLSSVYVGTIKPNNTVKSFCGLTCYIVAKRFYDTFLSVEEDAHIDQALTGLGKFVVCQPFTFIQHEGVSSNTGKFENYDRLLQGRELYDGVFR